MMPMPPLPEVNGLLNQSLAQGPRPLPLHLSLQTMTWLSSLAWVAAIAIAAKVAGDVLAGLGVKHLEFRPLLDHGGEMIKRDVTAGRRVVEAPVGVFLDRYRRCLTPRPARTSPARY